jgi:hypothetical protein
LIISGKKSKAFFLSGENVGGLWSMVDDQG